MSVSRQVFHILLLASFGLSASACIGIDDFIKIKPLPEPPIEKPYDPNHPDTTVPNQPGGSDGVDPDGNKDPNKPDELAALKLSAISPASGDVAGGYELRLRGAGFRPTDKVTLGALEIGQQTFVSDASMRIVAPSGKLGCVDVMIESADARQKLEQAFCYTQAIGIDEIHPKRVLTDAPVLLTVAGSGFNAKTQLYFVQNGRSHALIEPVVVSSSQMMGYLPTLSAGLVDLSMTNDAGHVYLSDAIEVVEAMTIQSIEPRAIAQGSQPDIHIYGKGLAVEDISIRIGAEQLTPSKRSSDKLTFKAPMLEAGSYDLVLIGDGQQARKPQALHYYLDDGSPKIFALDPSYGPLEGGRSEIIAVNFLTDMGVHFGTKTAKVLTVTPTLSVTVPAVASPQVVDVSLYTDTVQSQLANAYTYVQGLACTSLAPHHGPSTGGNTALLSGKGFDASLRVFFDAYEAEVSRLISPASAEIIVPAGSGKVAISVIQGPEQEHSELTYQYDESVEIYGLEPSTVPRGGGVEVHLLGRGLAADSELWLNDERILADVIAGNLLQFQAPVRPEGDYRLCLKAPNASAPLACTNLSYYETADMRTSAFGGKLEGALYVTVLQVGDAKPIQGATVMITSHPEHALTGVSDAEGRVRFYSPKLVGPQTVVACAHEFGCNSLQAVDARHITLLLDPWPKPVSTDPLDPPPPPPPPDPDAINPIDVTMPFTPTPAYVTGRVSGFDKLSLESDPKKVRAAMVIASQLGPNPGYYDKDDIRTVFVEGGKYKIRARRGDLALALLCGLYDEETKAFEPRFIGVKRHLFITNGVQIKADLDCPLPLNRTQSIKLVDAPLKSGPNMVQAHAYIYIGDEGYIGGFMDGISENDHVVVDKIPPFRDALAEASLSLSVGAYTNFASPSTVVYHYNVPLSTKTFEAGPAAPLPVFITKPEENVLKTGKIAWRTEHPENVDFYSINIRHNDVSQSRILWQIYLPGSATTAELPILDNLPLSGQLYINLTAYKTVINGYDFNHFSTTDLRHNYIVSSAWAGLNIALQTPGPQE